MTDGCSEIEGVSAISEEGEKAIRQIRVHILFHIMEGRCVAGKVERVSTW